MSLKNDIFQALIRKGAIGVTHRDFLGRTSFRTRMSDLVIQYGQKKITSVREPGRTTHIYHWNGDIPKKVQA